MFCVVCVSSFTTGFTGMDSLHESQGECELHAREIHAIQYSGTFSSVKSILFFIYKCKLI